MRITFVTEHYPPDPGGVATSSQRVAEALAGSGHVVQVLTFDSSRPLTSEDYVRSTVENGVTVNRIGPFFLRHPDLATISLSEKLRAVFRRRACNQMLASAIDFCPDAILSFYLLNAGFLARFVASSLRVPCFVGVRGNDIGLNIFHVERFAAIRWTLQGAAAVLCVNEHLRQRTLMMSPELADRTVVIPNGVKAPAEVPSRSNAKARLTHVTGWTEDTPVVVFVGTLREKKGIATLLSAFQATVQTSPVKLLVVGPSIGNVERRLVGEHWDRLVEEGHLFCTGQLPREQVPDWVVAADIIVMPSLDDGMANGLLEGMALGLCPVASHVFKEEIREGETGFLFEAGNATQLSELFARLATAPDLRCRVGGAARSYVREHHRPETEAELYIRTILALGTRLVTI